MGWEALEAKSGSLWGCWRDYEESVHHRVGSDTVEGVPPFPGWRVLRGTSAVSGPVSFSSCSFLPPLLFWQTHWDPCGSQAVRGVRGLQERDGLATLFLAGEG